MRQQPKLWDHQRGKKKRERERESFPMKGPTKRNVKGELEGTYSPPTPHLQHQRQRGRHGTARARRQGAATILAPETNIFHQTVRRLPVANHVFLGS